MEESDKLWNRINKFLENHTFQLFAEDNFNFETDFKVKLTGINYYITFGEKKEYIEYTLYVLPSNEQSDRFWGTLKKYFGEETPIPTSSGPHLEVRYKIQELLSNFLNVFGLDYSVTCTKIVNLVDVQD
jgi:hypothetical protein